MLGVEKKLPTSLESFCYLNYKQQWIQKAILLTDAYRLSSICTVRLLSPICSKSNCHWSFWIHHTIVVCVYKSYSMKFRQLNFRKTFNINGVLQEYMTLFKQLFSNSNFVLLKFDKSVLGCHLSILLSSIKLSTWLP